MAETSQNSCPQCGTKLPPRFSNGRVFCTKCRWSNNPENVEPRTVEQDLPSLTPKPGLTTKKLIDTSEKNVRQLGWILFFVGNLMMIYGLVFDATVESSDSSLPRTYNIGALNIKTTYTNTGGFMAVCGAIFTSYSFNHKNKGNE
jgi:uncharacterized Zn finger protein (UPF0148 family)